MTYTATNPGHSVQNTLAGRFVASLGNGLIRYAEKRSRQAEYAALDRLSDEELAARGMTRDDIVRVVFRDLLYI